jgi:hypothetical protein
LLNHGRIKSKLSIQDSESWKQERLMGRSFRCQACGHTTDIDQLEHLARAQAQSGSLRRFAGRVLPHIIGRRWTEEVAGHGLESLAMSRSAIYQINRLLRSMSKTMRRPSGARPLNEGQFAVVSCFFNPSGSLRKVKNFNRFLEGMDACGVRCLVVELAFGSSPHQLEREKDTIQLRSNDVMWHKERLLNIAIEQLLSESYQNIAWLDGDIQFEEPDWPQAIVQTLEEYKLCQVFSEASIRAHPTGAPVVGSSAVKYFEDAGGILYSQRRRGLADVLRGRLRGGLPGFGWAARAEVLEKVLLFENALVGGGDKLILAASLEKDLSNERLAQLSQSRIRCAECGHRNRSDAYTRCFMDWARRWSAAVDSEVGYAPLHIRDMYHGKRSDRGYLKRHDILLRHDFDPATDLAVSGDGGLQWTSDKPDLHREVEAYFLSRREDI